MTVISKRSLVVVGVLITVAVVALVAAELLGDRGREGLAQPDAVERVDSLLLTDNRLELSVCVDTISTDAPSVELRDRVDEALTDLRQGLADRSYQDEVLELFGEATVVAGCPQPAAADETTRFFDPRRGAVGVLGKPKLAPSDHVVHVYALSMEVFRDWFGDVSYVGSIEEMTCVGRSCAPATHGIYVTLPINPTTLREGLEDVLGLVPRLERLGLPTPTD